MPPKTHVFEYPPTANLYWRHVGPKVLISEDAKRYRKNTAVRAMLSRIQIIQGPVKIEIDLFRPIKSGDLDNRLKVLIDALRGIAYADDKQIVEIHARRFEDKTNPRAEVRIYEVKP